MRRLDDLPQDCHLSVNHSKVKIFIDICNSAKTMLLGKESLLGKGSSLVVGRGHGFISIIKSSARVESLGTALGSTTLQAKPAWARVRLNKFLNVYS